jgi:hypothetical protein
VVAHQVEPEPVDAVVPRPVDAGVDHDPGRHRSLGGDGGACRGGGDGAVEFAPVVVAGDDLVEHRAGLLPGRERVVEHDVEDDPQAEFVQRPDGAAQFRDAGSAVLVPGGGVAALGREPVPRVVAPVEGRPSLVCGPLLLEGPGGAGRGQLGDVGVALGGAVLDDGGEVEHGKELHAGEARLGEAPQMGAAVALDAEGGIGAAQVGRDAGVVAAVVADVEFVGDLVDAVTQGRAGGGQPAGLGPARVGEVGQDPVA